MTAISKNQTNHRSIDVYWAVAIYPCMFFFFYWLLPIICSFLWPMLPLLGIFFFLPPYMIWDDLLMKQGHRVLPGSGYYLIPYFVWIASWPAFVLISWRLKRSQQIGASILLIGGITTGLYIILKVCGMTLAVELP